MKKTQIIKEIVGRKLDPYIYWFFNIIKELKRGFSDKQK